MDDVAKKPKSRKKEAAAAPSVKDTIKESLIMKMKEEGSKEGPAKSAAAESSWELPIQLKLKGKQATPMEVNNFIRKLGIMLGAGLPLSRALQVLISRTREAGLRGVLTQVQQDIEKGSQFWTALAKHPNYFNSMLVNIIRTGEESGSLVKVIDYLASYRDREEEMVRSVQRSVTYPMFLLILAIGVVIILVSTIIPLFAKQYELAKIALPWPTKVVLWFSSAASSFWLLFFIALLLGIIIYKRADKVGGLKNLLDRAKLKMPVFGNILNNIYTVQFTSMMAILLRAGLPMPRTLELVRDTMSNILFKNAFQFVKDNIEKGRTLQESFAPIDVIQGLPKDMIAVGEEAGTMPEVLEQVAAIYQKEVDHEAALVGELLEPIMIVGMGIIVGFIAIAMFMPYFRMVTVVFAK